MILRVGFTGTRDGMTVAQRKKVGAWLERLIKMYPGAEFHHGCCTGADHEAHQMALVLGYKIHGYPSTAKTRAEIPEAEFDVLHEPEPPLVRDDKMVDATTFLIAAPKTREKQPFSGTWHTIGYAAKNGKTTITVYP